MTDWREELIEKMARSEAKFDGRRFDWFGKADKKRYLDRSRAALDVAEPVIREQCAEIADKTPYAFDAEKDMNTIAAAIREGGE